VCCVVGIVVLLQKNATVTIVHSRTKDAKSVVSRADIVVAAVGRAEMVRTPPPPPPPLSPP
jgi:5,10-methylene-tetrahydrofolate dehydrogenase/methenyl tetrahydrofolate cyclohydrolase